MNVWGKARDIEDVSYGFSTMETRSRRRERQGPRRDPEQSSGKGAILSRGITLILKVGVRRIHRQRRTFLPPGERAASFRRVRFERLSSSDRRNKTDWDSPRVPDVDLTIRSGYQVAIMPTNFRNGTPVMNLSQSGSDDKK